MNGGEISDLNGEQDWSYSPPSSPSSSLMIMTGMLACLILIVLGPLLFKRGETGNDNAREPQRNDKPSEEDSSSSNEEGFETKRDAHDTAETTKGDTDVLEPLSASAKNGVSTLTSNDNDHNKAWRCACQGGFLPPGLLQNFSGAEAVMRLGAGQCYHKQA